MRWSTLCPLPAGSAVLRDARCWHGGCAGTFPLHHVFVPGLHHRFHRKCFFWHFSCPQEPQPLGHSQSVPKC
jgi:hypothetical protein